MTYKAEVITVKELGETIGYGNLMDIASMLWEIDMKKRNEPVPSRLTKKLDKREKERREGFIKEIMQYV